LLRQLGKAVAYGVGVDVPDKGCEVVVGSDFSTFEIRNKQAASPGVHFIVGLGIAAEEVSELFADAVFQLLESSKLSKS